VTLPASADSNYFAIKAEDTRSKARGVTADGKYYLYTKASSSADGKSVSKAYYTSLGKLFGGETPEEIEAAPGTEGLTPLFNWKGYMLWLGKNGVYLNRPFEQDKAMIMVKDGLTSATDIKAGTVTAFVPDEGLGFDISADLGGMFNCGVGGKLATYCASSHDMCEGDKCVAKITGPACTPICTGKACGDDGCGGSCGTCDNGKGCTDGQCTGCACGNKACGPDGCGGSCGTCPVGYKCTIEQICGCLPSCVGKACGDDGCGGICGKCAPSLSCQDGKCVEGQPPSACNDTSCAEGSVCFDGKECLKKAEGTIETKVSHTTITPDSVIYEVTVTFTPSEDKNEYAISADDIYFKDGTTRQSYVKLVVAGTVKIQIKEPGSLAEQHAKVYVWPLYDASKGKVEWSKDNLSIDTTVLLSNPGHCNLIKQGAMKCPTGYSCKNHVCKAN
jgi:hypothetical protein